MMAKLLARWLAALYRRARFWFQPDAAPIEPPPAEIGHNRKRRSKKEAPESYGAFYYLDDVLDELDQYRKSVATMRRFDPDAYDFYSKVGAQIISQRGTIELGLPPIWTDGSERPSRGMLHFATREVKDDWLHGSLVSFMKVRGLPYVEASQHDSFEVTLFLTDPLKRTGVAAPSFYISVSPTGEIKMLRELRVHRLPVRQRRRNGVSGQGGIPQRIWTYPHWLAEEPEDARKRGHERPQTALERARDLFTIVASATENAADGFQIRASKAGICARFNVDLKRTPYFFKDRDKTVNDNGRTKKIFHLTRAHERTTAGGHKTFVRTHFRGERKFTWNGYRVTVSMPGLHHSMFQRLAVAAMDAVRTRKQPTLNAAQFGAVVADHMEKSEA